MLCLYMAISTQPRRRIPFKHLGGCCHSNSDCSSLPHNGSAVCQSVGGPRWSYAAGMGAEETLAPPLHCAVSVFRGIPKYKSILPKTCNGSLTLGQGQEGEGQRKQQVGVQETEERDWLGAHTARVVCPPYVCMCRSRQRDVQRHWADMRVRDVTTTSDLRLRELWAASRSERLPYIEF